MSVSKSQKKPACAFGGHVDPSPIRLKRKGKERKRPEAITRPRQYHYIFRRPPHRVCYIKSHIHLRTR